MKLPHLYLAADVHVCLTGRYYIFLDLRRNLYRSVNAAKAAPIASRVVGWGVDCAHPTGPAGNSSDEDQTLTDELLASQLLSRLPPAGLPSGTEIPFRREPAVTSSSRRASLTLQRALSPSVAAALIRAQIQLSFVSLHRIIAEVRRRKAARTGPQMPQEASTQAIRLSEAFGRWRPYFPRNHLCLYDSLALVHYLSANRIYPTWVFGVREEPFYAHCWVQADDVVLNDYADRVATFTPIMRV